MGSLAGALLMAACGGSESNGLNQPSDEAGAGSGGEAGDASATDGGGAGGSPTGGSGGTATGGGGSGTGGTSTGGTGGTIQDGGTDAGEQAAIATLNDPCSNPGQLACAGHAQKLQLLCDGTKWVANGVCDGTKLCDTRPGSFAGSCQEAVAECIGQQPGYAYCDGATLHICGPDLVTTTAEPCGSAELCVLNDGEHCAPCLPGEYRCDGADLEQCAQNMAGWSLVMTCASAGLCDAANATCGDQVCAPGSYRCTGDILEQCNSEATAWETVQACAAGLCDEAGKQCDICHPNTATCYNETAKLVCSADGQSLNAEPCSPPTGACMGGECVSCVPTTAEYTTPPLDMYLMVDRSGSMAGTPWTNQSTALNEFFQAQGSAGLGVAMRFFPLDDNCAPQNATCNGTSYTTPLVLWGTLPAQLSALQTAVTTTAPNGCFTPTQEALNGVLAGAKARKLAATSHVVIGVIVSDGEPCCGDCPVEDPAGLGAIAASYYQDTPSIRTFTISLATAANTVMATIAQQGGGSSYATAGATTAIQSALSDIRDTAGPCAFDIPTPDGGTIDPSIVSAGYLAPGATSPTALTKVTSGAACTGDGWYFDDAISPQQVLLCPTTCGALRANAGAKVRVTVDTCS